MTWCESGRGGPLVGEDGFGRVWPFVEEVDALEVSFSAHRRERVADELDPIDSEGDVGETGEVADEKDGSRPSVEGREGVAAVADAEGSSDEISECFPPSTQSSSSSSISFPANTGAADAASCCVVRSGWVDGRRLDVSDDGLGSV